jgi:hypothetical protein
MVVVVVECPNYYRLTGINVRNNISSNKNNNEVAS